MLRAITLLGESVKSLFDLKVLEGTGIQKMADIGLMPFFIILITSLIVSLLISHLYIRFYGQKGTGSTIYRAFPLLGVSITAIFVSLQFSIPLSLGLLGALSIVRFRTPIKDPEEVGFILLVIASSLSCATFNLPFLILILIIAVAALVILKWDKTLFRKKHHEALFVIKASKESIEANHEKFIKTLNSLNVGAKVDSLLVESLSFSLFKLDDSKLIDLKKKIKEIDNDCEAQFYYHQSQY